LTAVISPTVIYRIGIVKVLAVPKARGSRCVFEAAERLSVLAIHKRFRDNTQWGHVDGVVWIEPVPSVGVDDNAAFDRVSLDIVLAVETPADATIGAIVGSSKALNSATTLDELLLHTLL
jgi:hypothetical protein